jgi:hypothetical protein
MKDNCFPSIFSSQVHFQLAHSNGTEHFVSLFTMPFRWKLLLLVFSSATGWRQKKMMLVTRQASRMSLVEDAGISALAQMN